MSVTEKCKRLISGALSLILALGMCSGVSVQGHGPVAGTFSGSNSEKTDLFSAHFEKTDAAQVKFDHAEAQGVCAVEPRVDSFVGEFTNYSSDNPVSVNKELTYGSASETERALIDRRIATKLCAVSAPGLPLEITFRFSKGIQPKAYYLTGAGDDMRYPERVLSAWKLYGTNDEAGEWSLLDSHEGVTWQQNNETKMYSFSNSQSYTTFKLVIEKCGNTPTTNPNVIQFSGFGLGKEVKTTGSGEEVNYLYTSLSEGPSYNWAARSGAWSGVSCLHMEGTTTAKAAKNYVVLYDGLDIPVGKNTRLSYLVFPDIGTDYNLSANDPKKENWEPLYGDIEFRDVTFRYPDGQENILEHFNLKVPQGTNVAIVGETGAGKSTLVNLVCRFFEPTEGQVLIDGRDARERSQLWLHSNIGYVLQTPHLFAGSVLENLRYGNEHATMEQIEAAVRAVSADEIIARLPEGYESDVGEGGNSLSTGEKQLLSFARALLADPRIFVLDEATSSVDTVTERLIQNAIEKVMAGRTSFIIAHRLSTIRRADVILVVHGGRIVESGSHRELMAAKGAYWQLYTRQYREEQTRSIMET